MTNDKEKYAMYLNSREWALKRNAVRARCGGICERCNRNPMDHVHHLTYIRKYNELLEDLQGICIGCHEFTHGKSDIDPKESGHEYAQPVQSTTYAVNDEATAGNTTQYYRVVGQPYDGAPLAKVQKAVPLMQIQVSEVWPCDKCRLCQSRQNAVFGEGDPNSAIVFIGEGPGEREDESGKPFMGRAGELLDQFLTQSCLHRSKVYLTNIVKCRPPENRVPAPDEVVACTPYLERQLEIIRPRVIVTLGRPAAAYMLRDPKLTMGSIRGQWCLWNGVRLMPTFHPSYVLRTCTEQVQQAFFDDIKRAVKASVPSPLLMRSRV